MNLQKKYHVKEALHTYFFAVKGKLLFIWQNFLYNPSEKQNRLEEQKQSKYEHWNADIKNMKRKGADPGGIWKNISCYQTDCV